MRSIEKPKFKVREVFNDCISVVQSATLKQELENCVDIIEIAQNDFDSKCLHTKMHEILPKAIVLGNIGKAEMEKVYTDRMVPKGKPGRIYYDKLFLSAPGGKCPLCLQRIVTTLDHYLPKSKFPVFAVTPFNLIPACTDCNKTKLAEVPLTAEEQTLHPYYDNVELETWLKAKVLQTEPITFDFFVDQNLYSPLLTTRINKHFELFKINSLYGTHAVEEFQNIKRRLKNLFNNGGPAAVQEHLKECFESGEEIFLNSWYTAMYYSLANDTWFCNIGVNFPE